MYKNPLCYYQDSVEMIFLTYFSVHVLNRIILTSSFLSFFGSDPGCDGELGRLSPLTELVWDVEPGLLVAPEARAGDIEVL